MINAAKASPACATPPCLQCKLSAACWCQQGHGHTGMQMDLASGAGSIEGHDSSVGGVHTAAKLAVAGLHN